MSTTINSNPLIATSVTTTSLTVNNIPIITGFTVTLVDGATPALNAALSNSFILLAAGDRTIAAPTNPSPGQVILIYHYALGGTRTLSLNTGTGGFHFGSTIPALTATPSGTYDYIYCAYSSPTNKWDVIQYVKGF